MVLRGSLFGLRIGIKLTFRFRVIGALNKKLRVSVSIILVMFVFL